MSEFRETIKSLASVMNDVARVVNNVGWDYILLLENASKESDRGAVLIMHSAVDEALKELIVGFLNKNAPDATDEQEWLVSFQKSPVPPLGSYGVKTRFCYAAGLIDKRTKECLQKLGTVRNPFAHTWDKDVKLEKSHIDKLLAMIDEVEVREKIVSMVEEGKEEEEVKERLKMVYVVFYLLDILLTRISEVTGDIPKRLPKEKVMRVLPQEKVDQFADSFEELIAKLRGINRSSD